MAKAASIPGAVVVQPSRDWEGPPREVFFVAPLVMLALFLPVSIVIVRRVWKSGTGKIAAFPREVIDRLARLEQMGEATPLEVERIGEGQRFVTRLLTENRIGWASGRKAGEIRRQARLARLNRSLTLTQINPKVAGSTSPQLSGPLLPSLSASPKSCGPWTQLRCLLPDWQIHP